MAGWLGARALISHLAVTERPEPNSGQSPAVALFKYVGLPRSDAGVLVLVAWLLASPLNRPAPAAAAAAYS
jgi:hypothetical protein